MPYNNSNISSENTDRWADVVVEDDSESSSPVIQLSGNTNPIVYAENIDNAIDANPFNWPQENNLYANNNPDEPGRFGVVRDRLFQAMLIKFALAYSRQIPQRLRTFIEIAVFLNAIFLLCLLISAHSIVNGNQNSCLEAIKERWPRKGILRIEVIRNLDKVMNVKAKYREFADATTTDSTMTPFRLKDILIHGPSALPRELKSYSKLITNQTSSIQLGNSEKVDSGEGEIMEKAETDTPLWLKFLAYTSNLFLGSLEGDETEVTYQENDLDYHVDHVSSEISDVLNYIPGITTTVQTSYVYIAEYSLHYGLLRLSSSIREEYNVPSLLVQLDSDDEKCFGDWKSRLLMRSFVGFEDAVMHSLRALAENETEKGYIKDLMSGEHYHFLAANSSRFTYLTALFVMLIFTFAISMLLRFSHHQIFLFIIDLLQMFEMNQPIVFPVAPLLTVILALVGMEAIMSEIFNDASTAFYVILLVWMADQYDTICCHSSISKRHWLRFFYLYHFAFYIHQYRYNGYHSGLALLTSTTFIFHSMVAFFHRYELPHIMNGRAQDLDINVLNEFNDREGNQNQPTALNTMHPDTEHNPSRAENTEIALPIPSSSQYSTLPSKPTSCCSLGSSKNSQKTARRETNANKISHSTVAEHQASTSDIGAGDAGITGKFANEFTEQVFRNAYRTLSNHEWISVSS